MSSYHTFHMKQMTLEIEVLHPIYVQKKTIFKHFGWLAVEYVNIFRQDASGILFTEIVDFEHVGWLAIEDVDSFRQDFSNFSFT